MTTPIPQPRTIPFLGNTRDLDKDVPLKSFMLLAKKYGEIYQLDIFGTSSSLKAGRLDDLKFNNI